MSRNQTINFEILEDLIAFLCPKVWKYEDFEKVFIQSQRQMAIADRQPMNARLFCMVYGMSRERLGQLVEVGRVITQGDEYIYNLNSSELDDLKP
ncbi:MAG: hypothetical protein AMXMBFR48_25620 [Ignavibacteriales bacterium]